MDINLIMRPDLPGITGERFMREFDPFSVAIAGFVVELPLWHRLAPAALRGDLPNGPYVNMNHHEGVPRIETRATCSQALHAIRKRLFDLLLRDDDGPRATVYANDCDQDVCLAWFILSNPHIARSAINPALNRLVFIEDLLDTFVGAYPFDKDLPFLGEMAWVFEPYTQFRLTGGLDRRDAAAFTSVVTDVNSRIMTHVMGSGQSIPLDLRYDTIGGGSGWTMVRELGAQARTAMLHDGMTVFVSVRERADGRWMYLIGKLSDYDSFPLEQVCARMNELEAQPDDPWGGATNIKGSPRVSGSKINPDELGRVIDEVVSECS